MSTDRTPSFSDAVEQLLPTQGEVEVEARSCTLEISEPAPEGPRPTSGDVFLELGAMTGDSVPISITAGDLATTDGAYSLAVDRELGVLRGQLSMSTAAGSIEGPLALFEGPGGVSTRADFRANVALNTETFQIELSGQATWTSIAGSAGLLTLTALALCGCFGDGDGGGATKSTCDVKIGKKFVSCTGTCATGTCTLHYRVKSGGASWKQTTKKRILFDPAHEYKCDCV